MSANFFGVEFLKTTSIACRRPLRCRPPPPPPRPPPPPPPQKKKNRKEKGRGREKSPSPRFVLGEGSSVHRLHIEGLQKNKKNIVPLRPPQNVRYRCRAVTEKNVPASVMHEQFFYVSAAVALAVTVVVRLSSLKPEEK